MQQWMVSVCVLAAVAGTAGTAGGSRLQSALVSASRTRQAIDDRERAGFHNLSGPSALRGPGPLDRPQST